MRGLKRFFSFCIAGGIGALIEIGSFNILYTYLTFPPSKFIALAIALIVNFMINRNVTFSASLGKKRKQVPRYVLVYSLGILINYSVSLIANMFLGNSLIGANLSVVFGIIAGIPINFLGSLYWVFKDDLKNKRKTLPQ